MYNVCTYMYKYGAYESAGKKLCMVAWPRQQHRPEGKIVYSMLE